MSRQETRLDERRESPMRHRPPISSMPLVTRRRLLAQASAMAGSALLLPVSARRVLSQPKLSDYPFKLGLASGDPVGDGFVIWSRLAPDPLNGGGMPAEAVEVRFEVARDSRFL